MATKSCTKTPHAFWFLSMKLASSHYSGAQNFEVVPKFLKSLSIPALDCSIQGYGIVFSSRQECFEESCRLHLQGTTVSNKTHQ
jgi:hypothetical protein